MRPASQWIQVLEKLYHEVDIIKQVARQRIRQLGRLPQQSAGRSKLALGESRPVNKTWPRRP
jgi:hypothetical protein